jgi:FKBP-type peptidyl-prolyl cis-trans isomerase SlyD
MTIQNETVVGVHYTLRNAATGSMIENTEGSEPLVFLYGSGSLLPLFEENLAGKHTGDSFDFTIDAVNAYGIATEENQVVIPIEAFLDDQNQFDTEYFHIGKTIPLSDNEGNRMPGTILEIGEEYIKMDLNHPLSGVDLHFTGSVVSVRQATSDEIDHGHVHGPGGHHH